MLTLLPVNGQNGNAQDQVAAADEAADNDDSDDDEKEDEGGEGAATGGEISARILILEHGPLAKLSYVQRQKRKRSASPRRRRKAALKNNPPLHESPSQSYSPTINTPRVKSLSIKTRIITAPQMKRNDISTA